MALSSQDPELRGAWVAWDSIETASGRTEILREIIEANMNSVMVAVPSITGNHGEGSVENFVAFIESVAAAELVVLGWISNHKRTYPTPADLRLPEEREAQVQWAMDVLFSFPCLDGIAIDYIRYPEWEVSDVDKNEGVSDTILQTRLALNRVDKVLLSTTFPAATVTYRGTEPFWEGAVPQWYREWFKDVPDNYFALEAQTGGTGIINQGNIGDPNPEYLLGPSFMSYQQDPVTWMQRQLVDFITPMQYTADISVMQNEVDVWETWCSYYGFPKSTINIGLGWMDEPTSFPDSAFDPAAMVSHINYARSKGLGGFTLFRLGIPGNDDTPLIEALTIPNEDNNGNPPFAVQVSSPLGDKVAVQRSSSFCLDPEYLNALGDGTGGASSAPGAQSHLVVISILVVLFYRGLR